ncbi:tetratricopeptide repeat protein [Catalinimonas niigatensis]|uniref:tetratricopeptide repeat protein n=1 Tax=Catalinimonas niigatensis TaxID=1397264 RepID=UPI0026655988|nr:tetratricopeptide repeat protein [Catalinimonas niigatensis]WPP53023.1 tetratricopeptide repeat protein [Catalinimonas niigatensis]
MKKFISLLFFLSAYVAYGQVDTHEIDTKKALQNGQVETYDIDIQKDLLKNFPEPSRERADVLLEIGRNYWIHCPDSSEVYGMQALDLSTKIQYPKGMAFSNRVLGVSHWARGNHDLSLKYLLDALNLYQSLQDTLGVANVTMNMGLVYRDQKDYDNAFPRFFLAYDNFKRLGRKDRMASTANHLGIAYLRTEQLDKAKRYFEEAFALSKEIDFLYGLGDAYHNLGDLSHSQKQLDAALSYYEKSLEIQKIIDDWEGAAHNMLSIGMIYSDRKQYALAEEKLHISEEWAHLVSSKTILSQIYLAFKKMYEAQGKYQQALEYFDAYTIMQDSILNTQKARELARIEHEYALEKKGQQLTIQEQKIALLKQESEIKVLWVYILIVGLVLTAGLGFIFFRLQQVKNEKKRVLLEKQHSLTEMELENTRLKEEELVLQLEHKYKELTSYSLNFIQKNELVEDIKESIQLLKKKSDRTMRTKLDQIQRMLNANFQVDREWEDFRMHFEKVHHSFFELLQEKFPELTSNDLKLCTLVKLNMNLKESARIMGISPESVKTARYRLRKKLVLDKDQNLNQFLQHLEQDTPSKNHGIKFQKGTFSNN